MKKVTLLIGLIFAFGVFSDAQNLKFNQMEWNEEGERVLVQTLEPGKTYYVNTAVAEEFLQFEVDVINLLDSDQTVSLSMSVADGYTQGIDISGCWGECLAPWIFRFDPVVIEKDTLEAFSIDYFPNGITNGNALVTCTFSSEGYDDFTFYTQFTDNVSINSPVITTNKAYPNPASSVLNIDYSVNSPFSNAQITLYNILGVVVNEQKLSGTEGTISINVSDFAQGVYFYSIKADGKTMETKKVIIAR